MKADAAKPVKTAKVKKPLNIWRMTLILLAVVVLSAYIVSWIAAKFVSKQDSGDAARVANFSCSAVIDDVSALSFTNTAFWTGEHNDRVAMNALRTLHVVVRNWDEVDGEKRIAEVPTSYDLQFTAPANFVEKLAVQFADHVEHHGDHVVLPQIDIEAVIAAAKEENIPMPSMCQPSLSLLNTGALADMLPLCAEQGIGVIPYQILQGGMLTGKYRRGQAAPAGSRLAEKPEWMKPFTDEVYNVIEHSAEMAAARGISMTQYAIQWALEQPAVVSTLVGVKREAQIDEAAAALK